MLTTENSRKLTVIYAALGHLLMHMFAAFYFVIVLAIEDEWKFSYDELLNLWFLGSLLVGIGSLPAGWISDRWSRSGMIAIMFSCKYGHKYVVKLFLTTKEESNETVLMIFSPL